MGVLGQFIKKQKQKTNKRKDENLKPPSTRNEWKHYADQFKIKWQLPQAVGAIYGKHVNIRAPLNSGSEYFNYKKQFSRVSLAIADANAKRLLHLTVVLLEVSQMGEYSKMVC